MLDLILTVTVLYVSLVSALCSVSKSFTVYVFDDAVLRASLLYCLVISFMFFSFVIVFSTSFICVLLLCTATSFVVLVSTVLVSVVLVVLLDASVA